MTATHFLGSESPLIYGCMRLGGGWDSNPPSPEAIAHGMECLRTASAHGITFFDHADIYTRGKAETVFGHAWSELGLRRADVIVQTKCGIRFANVPEGTPHRLDLSAEHILRSVEGSLKRLKTDFLDVLLLHRPDPLVEPDEVARAFDELKSQALVRHFGVSNHNAAQIALLNKSVGHPLITNQLEFNLLHNDLLDEGITVNHAQRRTTRGDGTLEFCRAQGIAIQAYSPVARGRMTPVAHDADNRTRAAAAAVAAMAQKKGVPTEAILIAWILRHPAKIQPVLGSANLDRIRAACAGVNVQMSREEWYELYIAARGEDFP